MGQYTNPEKMIVLEKNFVLITLIAWILLIVWRVRLTKIKLPNIRRLAAMDSIDEAVGRAVELDRPILGIIEGDLVSRAAGVLSGLNVIGYVARLCAEKGAKLIATTYTPILIPPLQAQIESNYASAGKVEDVPIAMYQGERIASTVANLGHINREKVAGIIFVGRYGWQSLPVFEAGKNVGSIVICGNDNPTQYPFLAIASDYWLLGEELYAASAYLSKTPFDVGTIEAQDFIKYIALAIIAAGIVVSALGSTLVLDILAW